MTTDASERSPSVIADAASIIAFTTGCDQDEAFEALSRQSNLQQMAMRDLATAVVYEGQCRGRVSGQGNPSGHGNANANGQDDDQEQSHSDSRVARHLASCPV